MNQTFNKELLKDKRAYGRIINLIPDERNENKNVDLIFILLIVLKVKKANNCLLVLT